MRSPKGLRKTAKDAGANRTNQKPFLELFLSLFRKAEPLPLPSFEDVKEAYRAFLIDQTEAKKAYAKQVKLRFFAALFSFLNI